MTNEHEDHARQLIDNARRNRDVSLRFGKIKLSTLPTEIGQLDQLRRLEMGYLELESLPAEIGLLINLEELTVYVNNLTSLPREIADLSSLRKLGLSANKLGRFPPEILNLNLEELRLTGNGIAEVPSAIGRFSELKDLRLRNNRILELPAEIGNLVHLQRLDLRRNQLSALPPALGQLSELERLDLDENPIIVLPVELGRCQSLKNMSLSDPGRFRFPPGDVVELGTDAILRYLRAADSGAKEVWESKLLLVGEGAVGKTWLYEALNGRPSGGTRKDEGATIGIEIGPLDLDHPGDNTVQMRLNCWDFAGQDINHATHQFFFSERTLFLLCWSARAGWEAGKLRKWLTNIRDRAPAAQVLLIATHSDQPHSDYPEKELRAEFGQIVGTFKVSSETGEGIEELKREIALNAKDLPMMGLRWPTTWRAAQQAVHSLRERGPYAGIEEVRRIICECRIEEADAIILMRWLHELGEILYYQDVPELADLVMLDPQWVTSRVGEVLANVNVQNAKGILERERMEQIWPKIHSHVRQHLLGMMERFDLAYRIPDDQEHRCLVVERLPQNPPDYERRWRLADGQPEVRLRYRLRAVHPGIPTWFIARCHRFTLGLHWLRGVVFGDNRPEPRHLALIVANESERTVNFAVRGPQPWTFLPLLTDGFEDTVLKRYPGLEFDRLAPCPGRRRNGSACNYEFNLKDLEALRWPEERDMEAEYQIRCTRCRTKHDIDTLLLGLSRAPGRDAETLQEILKAVHAEGELIRTHFTEEMVEARQFIQLMFVQEWNREQELEEQSCPIVFALYPVSGTTLTKEAKLHLQLYCMNPGCWHSVGPDGACEFQPTRCGLVTAASWVRTGLRWLRPVAALLPSGSQLAGEYGKELHDFAEHAANELKFTAEIFKELKEIRGLEEAEIPELGRSWHPRNQLSRIELHELKAFLEALAFPVKPFGGLRRIRTPEGHILWLCSQHATEFARSIEPQSEASSNNFELDHPAFTIAQDDSKVL